MYLFDHTVKPILTYGSEVWGSFKSTIPNIEDMTFNTIYHHSKNEYTQRKFARFLLGVPKQCSINALLGELGWNPIYASIVPTVIKYWHRIVNEPQDTLLSNALSVHQHMKHSGEDNICDTISLMISKLGLTATLQELKELSPDRLKFVLRDAVNSMVQREWNANVHQGNAAKDKLRTYKLFKTSYGYEPYINHIKQKTHRYHLTKFRTGTLPLSIETGRYCGVEESKRVCQLCPDNRVESEVHFLTQCTFYSQERTVFLKAVNITFPNVNQLSGDNLLIWLMSCEDKTICQLTSKFIYDCFAKRTSHTNEKPIP
jgi:hypothetical protein